MKRWRFLSAICAFMISCAVMPIATVTAEELVSISLEPVYEFPIVGEVYIYEGQNYHLGDYKTLDMTVKLFIEPDGNAEFLFVANQDFVYESEKTYEVYIDNRTSRNEHVISIDAPYWCTVPSNTVGESASYVNYSGSAPKTGGSIGSQYDMYDTSHKYYSHTYHAYDVYFYNAGYHTDISDLPVSFFFISDYHKYLGDNKYTVITTGDAIGRVRVEPSHPIVYVSDDQRQFIVEENEKKYVDDDMFVTFTIDGTSITKEIGLHYDDSPAMIYKQGDANNDGSLNITDVVLLQKWLLAEPDVHFETWCSVDMNHDSRLDVFDLCLMKRALLDK